MFFTGFLLDLCHVLCDGQSINTIPFALNHNFDDGTWTVELSFSKMYSPNVMSGTSGKSPGRISLCASEFLL